MFPFKRAIRALDPATEAGLIANEALGAFEAVVGQLTVAKGFLNDAINDSHLTAQYHRNEAARHDSLVAEHQATLTKHNVVIERVKSLLGD